MLCQLMWVQMGAERRPFTKAPSVTQHCSSHSHLVMWPSSVFCSENDILVSAFPLAARTKRVGDTCC